MGITSVTWQVGENIPAFEGYYRAFFHVLDEAKHQHGGEKTYEK
jgi:hypothetical protein